MNDPYCDNQIIWLLTFYSNFSDVSNGILITRMRYRRPNSRTQKNISKKTKLKMTENCLKCLLQQCRSIKFKIFWPLYPTMSGWGEGGASRDTKTSDFRYKRYPLKNWISHEFPYSLLRTSFRSKLRNWSCINNLTLLFYRPFDFAKPLDFAWRN